MRKANINWGELWLVLIFVGLGVSVFLPAALAQETEADFRLARMVACYEQEVMTGLPGRVVTEDEARAYYSCLNQERPDEEIDYDLPHKNFGPSDYRSMGDPHDLEVPRKSKINLVVECYLGTALDFNWFGSRSTEDAFGNCGLTIDNIGKSGGWELFLAESARIGSHKPGSLVNYNNLVVKRIWVRAEGRHKTFIGFEVFNADSQYGNPEETTFLAPLFQYRLTPNEAMELNAIVQVAGTHNTTYDGDRIFGVLELVLHPLRGKRLLLDLTLAGVYGETGRVSAYTVPKLTVKVSDQWSVWVKAGSIYTWGADDVDVFLSPEPLAGFKWVKPVR